MNMESIDRKALKLKRCQVLCAEIARAKRQDLINRSIRLAAFYDLKQPLHYTVM